MGGLDTLDKHHSKVDETSPERNYEASLLRAAIKRSSKIFRPQRVKIEDERNDLKEKNLRVGFISRWIEHTALQGHKADKYELKPWSPDHSLFIDGDPDTLTEADLPLKATHGFYQILVPSDIHHIEHQRDTLLETIKGLCEKNANIICMNELGYPSFEFPANATVSQEDRERLKRGDVDFRTKLQALADQYGCVIVGGTYHDAVDMHNKAMIFFPDYTLGVPEHLKLTSAKSENVGEVIRTPRNDHFPFYQTRYGEVSVLICMDAYDLNMFFRQMYKGILSLEKLDYTPDIIVVPAYTSVSIVDACRALSYFTASTVLYCNAKTCNPYNAIFVGGEPIHERANEAVRLVEIECSVLKKYREAAQDKWKNGLIHSIHETYPPPESSLDDHNTKTTDS